MRILREIFKGDSLSPLLLVLRMISMILILRKVAASYKWGDKEFRINNLLFIDDLKLFAKNQNQINSLHSFLLEPVKLDPRLSVFKICVIFRVYCS